MARLIDTNVLVYAFDPRFPEKREIAGDLLRTGLARRDVALPHQAILEFVAVVQRPLADLGGAPLVPRERALQLAEQLTLVFPVLYPDEDVLRTALRGASTYGLSWFDAHLWAYAEVHGLPELLSEDFEHGRHYGRVRAVDPFLAAAGGVHELPAIYGESSSGDD